MACYKPLSAHQNISTGEIVWNKAPSANYLQPIQLKCGQCVGCRLGKNSDWALRCTHESKCHDKNCFITLTYDDEHLPVNGSLVKRDYQLFLKRWRKQLAKKGIKISFYLAGEYGEQTERPHYHACIFGYDPEDKQLYKTNHGNALYTSESLNKAWGKGMVVVGALTEQSAAYTASYVMKKITGDQAEQHYQRVNLETGEIIQLEPEFASMSRSKGIGYKFFTKYQSDIYPSDHVINANFKEVSVPNYYDRKYKETNPDEFEQIQFKRKERAKKHRLNNTPERLAVREQVAKARLKLNQSKVL